MKARPALAKSLSRLNTARVKYLMIGVLALNHYAKDPAAVYSSLDCDLLLPLDEGNLRRKKVFSVAGVRVPCADIEDILEAKRRAGRGKDLAFLKIYRAGRGT